MTTQMMTCISNNTYTYYKLIFDDTMLRTVFSFDLAEKIIPGRVAIGYFDGNSPCLVAATSADKVLVHNPHEKTAGNLTVTPENKSFLNINQTIQVLAAGCLKDDSSNDVLIIGTPTSLFAYDVENNTDIFYREIPDGANSVAIGKVAGEDKPLAIAGGNCALQGFDADGNDCFWTVTGDNITSMVLYDINDDGQNELLVGSEDYDIRVFKGDAILYELSETDTVTFLCPILPHAFAYALANGTVGVYHKQERLWRIKSKNQAVSIVAWDINGDGTPELVTGWSSGKVDGRNIESGEVIFKDNFSQSIASIMLCDYNMDGIQELVVCSTSGEVRGYVAISGSDDVLIRSETGEEGIIRQLMRRKQNILLELRNFEENNRISQTLKSAKAASADDRFGVIPASTQLKSSLTLCSDQHDSHIQFSLSTSNDTIIRSAVIFAEGIFSGESFVIHPHPSEVSSHVKVTIRPEKNIAVDLHIKSLVGYKDSFHFHVFELTRRLPKFSMFLLLTSESVTRPNGSVRFTLSERIDSILLWMNKSFILGENFTESSSDSLSVTFLCLRDGKPLMIQMSDEPSNNFYIRTDDMELAGDLLQSLVAEHLGIDELSSIADFPQETEHLKRLVARVEEVQSVRQQLAADIADNSANLRTLVVKAEDARLLRHFSDMKNLYTDLNFLNRELMNEYRIRSQNQQDLVSNLKQINGTIQKAGNLRIGKSKANLIQACRAAIKQNNLTALSKIISSGQV